MKKKSIAILLVVMMTAAFCGCGKTEEAPAQAEVAQVEEVKRVETETPAAEAAVEETAPAEAAEEASDAIVAIASEDDMYAIATDTHSYSVKSLTVDNGVATVELYVSELGSGTIEGQDVIVNVADAVDGKVLTDGIGYGDITAKDEADGANYALGPVSVSDSALYVDVLIATSGDEGSVIEGKAFELIKF